MSLLLVVSYSQTTANLIALLYKSTNNNLYFCRKVSNNDLNTFNTMTQSGRLLSLDIMRGITIAGMILVNNAGNWQYVFKPLHHANWDGLTPTDLVFPFFMFIMGVSMYFSLRKYNFEPSKESVKKILKRTFLIFLVGYVLHWFESGCYQVSNLYQNNTPLLNSIWVGFTDFQHTRILGVLQRLALAYGAGSLLGLFIKHKHILYVAGGILLFYWALLSFTNSTTASENNIIAIIDKAIFGADRMYRQWANGVSFPFDPEGFLSALPSVAHVLFGFYCGKMITDSKKNNDLIIRNLFIFGTILLFARYLLSYGCPINKKLWSSTFVLVSCGAASLFLALLIWIVDIKGKKKWGQFFEVFGINPLYLYVQAGIVATFFGIVGFSTFMCNDVFTPVFGNYGGSLAWSVFFVLLNWIPGYYLYKKQIYIKL